MNIFRKVITGVGVFAMCGVMCVGNVNATTSTYIKGDVNGDGSVNLADLSTMNQFLNGMYHADGVTAERLDVNRDFVIDKRDANIISSIILGDTNADVMYSQNTSSLPAQDMYRIYRKYAPDTGSYNGSYVLFHVNNIPVSSNTSTYSIVGEDNRDYEDGLECVVRMSNSNGELMGTAFIVDSNTILTAASRLYSNGNIISGLNYSIYSNRNTESDVQITPTSYHIPQEYISGNGDTQKYNYALITVAEDLSDYIGFNLGVMRNGLDTGSSEEDIYVTGFSSYEPSANSAYNNQKVTGMGHLLYNYFESDYVIAYDTDTTFLECGAPVYLYDQNKNVRTVIGINCTDTMSLFGNSSYNEAVRITPEILHAVYNNQNL